MSFSRFENMDMCLLEQKKLGHSPEDCAKICGGIHDRAQKGALLKAAPLGLEVLTKASEPDIILGGYASWECVDDDGDLFTVDAQAKALQKFFAQPPEYQSITINHGRGLVKEMKIAQPMLKAVDSQGVEHFSHVNEKGTYLISKIRPSDSLKSTEYYREKARNGELNGYSVNVIPLAREGNAVTDMEYTAITVTEKGVMVPRNPMARDVKVLTKAADLAVINDEGKFVPLPQGNMQYPHVLGSEDQAVIESILAKHGFNKCKPV
jgi:hypothetical protein